MNKSAAVVWIAGGIGIVLILAAYHNVSVGSILSGNFGTTAAGSGSTPKRLTPKQVADLTDPAHLKVVTPKPVLKIVDPFGLENTGSVKVSK